MPWVTFGMKGMKRTVVISALLLRGGLIQAQGIQFLPTAGQARIFYMQQDPRTIGHCTDSLRVDTIYMEDATTGEMVMTVQTYPLARYEYYVDGAMYRRIDIAERYLRTDTLKKDLLGGEVIIRLQEVTEDLPKGNYHEFFPNGNIRLKGMLDGYNPDGTPKKTGAWTEWGTNGKVIRQETYP